MDVHDSSCNVGMSVGIVEEDKGNTASAVPSLTDPACTMLRTAGALWRRGSSGLHSCTTWL